MSDRVVEALILDLLEWVATGDKTYEEVMDAWRTSCPKLTIWEEANERGLVTNVDVNGRSIVRITPAGVSLIKRKSHLAGLKPCDGPDGPAGSP